MCCCEMCMSSRYIYIYIYLVYVIVQSIYYILLSRYICHCKISGTVCVGGISTVGGFELLLGEAKQPAAERSTIISRC